ncbi:hypothetical protein FSP39_009867, partial [Pinctada imbricata]
DFMEQNISHIVDDEIDDPAIVNASRSRDIPRKTQNLDDIFGPSSPPALLDTEHLVSPSSKNIWGSPIKDSHLSQPPVNNLQTLFDFAKAASSSPHPQMPSAGRNIPSPVVKGKTLEELEEQLLPKQKGTSGPITAEELERQMRGEDQRVPQMAPRDPRFSHPPPGYFPPPGSPAARYLQQASQAQRVPPGRSPYQPPVISDGRRSPLAYVPGSTPPGPVPPHLLDGRRSPVGVIPGTTPPSHNRSSPIMMIHGQSPLAGGMPHPGRTTPSPPPVMLSGSPMGVPPARLMSPYANRAMIHAMGNRMPTPPMGIPRPMGQRPPNHSPYSHPPPPHGPYDGPPPGPHHQSPHSHGSPYGHHMNGPHRGGNRGLHHNGESRDYRPPGEHQHRPYPGDHQHRPYRRYYRFNEEEDRKRSIDGYAGLMTQKEKDWIVKIQLIQLQSDNPYLDDYYYTTFTLKKKAEERKRRQENGIFDEKDSELNLIIPAMAKLETRPYKPAQFEGSLGRLTTSSVHNPRQIIDVGSDIPHTDDAEPQCVSKELRRSRQLLMEIEKGYNLLLDVDDIDKKMLALPDDARKPLFEDRKNMLSDLYKYLLCTHRNEHFLSILSIRKGRKLISRVLPLLEKRQSEDIVLKILKNLQYLIKKDSGEEGLMVLHDPVILVIENSDLEALVKFSDELKETGQNQTKATAVAIQNKFGSSVICSLLHRGEVIHSQSSPLDMDSELESVWCQFVHDFAGILAVVPTESLVHPKHHHQTVSEHFDRLLNKKLIALIEDKVKLFTESQTS